MSVITTVTTKEKEWTLIDSVSVTGTTGAENNKTVSIPSDAKELLLMLDVEGGVVASTLGLNDGTNLSARFAYAPNSATITQTGNTQLQNSGTRLHVYINYATSSTTMTGKLYYR